MIKVSKFPTEQSPAWNCGACGADGEGEAQFNQHQRMCLDERLRAIHDEIGKLANCQYELGLLMDRVNNSIRKLNERIYGA